jgi:uncharacterized membrane protein
MSAAGPGPDVGPLEIGLSHLLRIGVTLAAVVVLAGGLAYLWVHGREPADDRVFRGEPAELRHPVSVIESALARHGRGVIQFGLLLLIATPVARVVGAAVGFAFQRDRLYVGVTLVVLAILLYSLLGTHP